MKYLLVNDGDEISVLVAGPQSLADPSGITEATGQSYRVVATQEIIVLVPLAPKPFKITKANSPNWQERIKNV